MKINTIIFDRDGVLLDFDEKKAMHFFMQLIGLGPDELMQRWDAYGAQYGFPKNVDEETKFFKGFWDHISEELQLNTDIREKLHQVDYLDFLFVFPEVLDVLQKLQDQTVKMGVLSNFALASLESSLKRAKLLHFMDVTCAATVIGAAKPDPRAYQIILEQLNAQPEECLFFDNKIQHVEGARRIGMRAFLVDRSLPEDNLPQDVVHSLAALPSIMNF